MWVSTACSRAARNPHLVAQAERGFAHVPEKALEDLLVSKGKAVPECDEDDVDRKMDGLGSGSVCGQGLR